MDNQFTNDLMNFAKGFAVSVVFLTIVFWPVFMC